MVTAINNGLRAEKGFKKPAWTTTHKALKKKYPEVDFKMMSIKSKIEELKKKYRVFQKLCNNSGFKRDAIKKIPTAPENVWVEYISERKLCIYWNDFFDLFLHRPIQILLSNSPSC